MLNFWTKIQKDTKKFEKMNSSCSIKFHDCLVLSDCCCNLCYYLSLLHDRYLCFFVNFKLAKWSMKIFVSLLFWYVIYIKKSVVKYKVKSRNFFVCDGLVAYFPGQNLSDSIFFSYFEPWFVFLSPGCQISRKRLKCFWIPI